MSKIKIPKDLREEFLTVKLILKSPARTSRVDALILSWTKYEKQLRKLLCFLVFQNPEVIELNRDEYYQKIIENKKLYPDQLVQAINGLGVGPVAQWIGVRYEELEQEIGRVGAIRNKLMHGQITGRKLGPEPLERCIRSIVEWIDLLGCAAKKEIGYDGLDRNTFRKAKSTPRLVMNDFPFQTAVDFDRWIKTFTHNRQVS